MIQLKFSPGWGLFAGDQAQRARPPQAGKKRPSCPLYFPRPWELATPKFFLFCLSTLTSSDCLAKKMFVKK